MNKEEAIKVIIILMNAHDGCSYCGRELCLEFVEDFQEFKELTEKMFKKKYGEELFPLKENIDELGNIKYKNWKK